MSFNALSIILFLTGFSVSALGSWTDLTSEKNPACNPCEWNPTSDQSSNWQLRLVQRPIQGLWETVQIKMHKKGSSEAQVFSILTSEGKKNRFDPESVLALDYDEDGDLDIAYRVSHGLRESQYSIFIYDSESQKYEFLNPDEPQSLNERDPQSIKPEKETSPKKPSKNPSKPTKKAAKD